LCIATPPPKISFLLFIIHSTKMQKVTQSLADTDKLQTSTELEGQSQCPICLEDASK
jgi:hypothetical protein